MDRTVDETEFTPYPFENRQDRPSPSEVKHGETGVHGPDKAPREEPFVHAAQEVTVPASTVQSMVISKSPDTFHWDGKFPHNKTLPFPHWMIPPSDRGSTLMRSWSGWVTTGYNHARHALFRPVPVLHLNDAGNPVVVQAYYQRGNTSEEAITEDRVDLLAEQAGGRNNSLILPYITGREIPGQPGLSMICSLSGWLAHMDLSGKLWDCGGYRTPPGEMHRLGGKSKTWHGNYDAPLNGPNDFAFHPGDAHVAFVCDTYHDRLVRLHGARPPEWHTVVQFPQGTWPYSCEFIGDVLYVCLRGKVSAGNRVVKITGLLTDGTPQVADAFTGLWGPQCIRRSGQELRVVTVDDMWLHAVNPASGARKTLARITTENGQPMVSGKWTWLYVDNTGSQGPVGDLFIMISGTSFPALRRVWETETGVTSAWMRGNGALMSGSTPYVSQDPYGHYGWAIWGSESGLPIMWHNGFGGMGIHGTFYRPNAPRTWDSTYFTKGRGHWEASSATDPLTGNPGRASIALMHGNKGYGLLGNDIKTIEELYLMPWAEFATYIRGGAGGKYPRPWLTDDDLRAIRYFAKCSGPYAIQSLTVDPIGHTPTNIYPPSAPSRIVVPPTLTGSSLPVSWEASENIETVKQYVVVLDDTETLVPPTQTKITLTDVEPGLHTVAVYAESQQGRRSITTRISAVEVTMSNAPLPATELAVEMDGADVHLTWTPSNSETAKKQEVWKDGVKLAEVTIADAAFIHELPGKLSTYTIKTLDDEGRTSEASVTTVLPDVD